MNNPVKLFLVVILFTARIAGAENSFVDRMAPGDSLQHYMKIASENNHLVMQRLNEYRASLEKVRQVGSLPDPELTTGIFLSPMELIAGNQVAEVSLMQMLPWFGVLKNSKDEMSLMALAKYESFKDAKTELYFNVQRTWYQYYTLKEEIIIAEKNIALLHTIERLALTRFKNAPASRVSSSSSYSNLPQSGAVFGGSTGGSMGNMTGSGNQTSLQSQGSSMQGGNMQKSLGGGSLSDLYRIQIEINEIKNNIDLLKNRESTIRAQFNALLNRPLNTNVFLPDTLLADTLSLSLIAITDSMLRNNPMLNMIEYEQQSLEARRLMNNRMAYPMVGIGLNYSVINESMMSTSEMNGTDMIMPMVKLTLPVYRKKYRALEQETVLQKEASADNFQATSNMLKTEVYAAVQSYTDARRMLELNRNQYTLARKSLDLMIKDFSVSGAALTDILRVRQQTLEYEYKLVEAMANYNTSIAYIRRLMAGNTQ